MPNPNTIPWIRYQDIQIEDTALQQQFQQYYSSGQYSQALSLLNNNTDQLQGKAFIANTINTIASGVLVLEQYFNTGVTVYLSNLATQYTNLINHLRKRKKKKNTIQYTPYNFVVYNNDIYMCFQQPPIGTLPTDTTYWLYLGLRGIQGDPGIDVNIRYDWNSTNTYSPDDVVIYNGDMYIALTTNTNVVPTSSSTDWLLFLKIEKGQIYVGTIAPSNPPNNAVWFQTESDPSQATTTTPIVGQFMRYIAQESIWDEMYPNILFTWIVDKDNYAPTIFLEQVDINQNDWSNNTWTYTYNNLTEQSVVNILPSLPMTSSQINLYNNLNISISGTVITLTSNITPQTDLTIQIQII